MKKVIGFVIFLFFFQLLFAQNAQVDPLLHKIEMLEKKAGNPGSDTARVNTLVLLCLQYKNTGEYEKALEFANQALTLAEKINYKKGIADACLRTGNVKDLQGDHLPALDYYFKAQKIYEEINDNMGIARAVGNIGIVYQLQGNYPKSLEYFFKALKMGEELQYKQLIANTLGNTGITYYNLRDLPHALEYYLKALKIAEEMGDRNGIVRNLTNIGIVYNDQQKYDKALEYDMKALKLAEELDYKYAISNLVDNIGSVYSNQKKFDLALDYHFKALKMSEEMGDKIGMARNLGNIGFIYMQQNNLKDAETFLKKALSLSGEISYLRGMQALHQDLSELYGRKNQWKTAMEHYQQSVRVRDSLFNEENTKKNVQAQMNYEFDKKMAAEKQEQEKREAAAAAEKKRQKLMTWLVTAVALAIAIIAGIIFRSLHITRRQKKVIEEQKILVDQKNKHITDSINYAKRIQDSILPSRQELSEYFKECFIFFRPRDIVSGDFYWYSALAGETGKMDKIIFAVADCTGHGVPGAFMSMIGNTLLNEIVNELKVLQPSEILNHLNEGIAKALHQESRTQDDGMDISVCLFDKQQNKATFAGANHSMYVVKNRDIRAIQGDIYSIGRTFGKKNVAFTQTTIPLEKDTMFYFTTDGFSDQKGGENGKKFQVKQLEKLFSDISGLPVQEQEKTVVHAFELWKGSHSQLDDVLTAGIRF